MAHLSLQISDNRLGFELADLVFFPFQSVFDLYGKSSDFFQQKTQYLYHSFAKES